MKKHFRKTFEKRIRDYSDVNYELIEVSSGECHYNYKCHMNAVHIAWRDKHPEIALVMYRREGSMLPCVHFINIVDDKFVDNTLGEWSRGFEYRLMKKIKESEFKDVDTLIGDAHNFFNAMASPLEKLFSVMGDV